MQTNDTSTLSSEAGTAGLGELGKQLLSDRTQRLSDIPELWPFKALTKHRTSELSVTSQPQGDKCCLHLLSSCLVPIIIAPLWHRVQWPRLASLLIKGGLFASSETAWFLVI